MPSLEIVFYKYIFFSVYGYGQLPPYYCYITASSEVRYDFVYTFRSYTGSQI